MLKNSFYAKWPPTHQIASIKKTPFSLASLTSSFDSFKFMAMGFSRRTCLPASSIILKIFHSFYLWEYECLYFFITLPPGSGTGWPAQRRRCPRLCPRPEVNIPPPPSRRRRARRTRGPCLGTCEGKGCSCCHYCFGEIKNKKNPILCIMFLNTVEKRALHNQIWSVRGEKPWKYLILLTESCEFTLKINILKFPSPRCHRHESVPLLPPVERLNRVDKVVGDPAGGGEAPANGRRHPLGSLVN